MATPTSSTIVSGTTDAPSTRSGPSAARDMIWRLEASGWTPCEAANLVALAHGLRPASDGWTDRQIEHLLFLRSLVQAGRIAS